MLDKGMVGLLRERHEPFRRAIALLLEGCVYRQYFIGAARRILEIMHDWQSYSSMEATAPRRAEITKLLQRVESDCTGLLQSLPLLCDHLDTYIVGQDTAKRSVAVAVRNRWRRQQLSEEMRREIAPKNIILIGPTGVGKTETSPKRRRWRA